MQQKTESCYKYMLLFVSFLKGYKGRKQNNKPPNR